MARPPQYERQEEPWDDAKAVKAALKPVVESLPQTHSDQAVDDPAHLARD
jgi:hypothetical protein